jgi:hypothetical protein
MKIMRYYLPRRFEGSNLIGHLQKVSIFLERIFERT